MFSGRYLTLSISYITMHILSSNMPKIKGLMDLKKTQSAPDVGTFASLTSSQPQWLNERFGRIMKPKAISGLVYTITCHKASLISIVFDLHTYNLLVPPFWHSITPALGANC